MILCVYKVILHCVTRFVYGLQWFYNYKPHFKINESLFPFRMSITKMELEILYFIVIRSIEVFLTSCTLVKSVQTPML